MVVNSDEAYAARSLTSKCSVNMYFHESPGEYGAYHARQPLGAVVKIFHRQMQYVNNLESENQQLKSDRIGKQERGRLKQKLGRVWSD